MIATKTKKAAFIHVFRSPNGYYLYDVNTNRIVALTESLYDYLSKKTDFLSDADEERLEKFKKLGLLKNTRIENVKHCLTDDLQYHLDNKIAMMTLQVTQNCNLRCAYCIYSGSYNNRIHTNKRMSLETALKAIDFYVERGKYADYFSIGFYGGEPLLEMPLIKKCVAYMEEKTQGRTLHFTLTTNATLLTREMVEYFEKKDFGLMISLDGPEEIHNKNRIFAKNNCGTFNEVMKRLDFIKKDFPEYFKKILFSVVLDPENDFSCVNDFYMNFDGLDTNNLNTTAINPDGKKDGEINYSEEYVTSRNYELFKVYLSKFNRYNEKLCSPIVLRQFNTFKEEMHFQRLITDELRSEEHHGGPCMPGVQRLFVNCDGEFFPCERVSESSEAMMIGNIHDGFNIEKAKAILNIGKITEKECKNCWAIRHCNICASSVDVNGKLSYEQKLKRCKDVRFFTVRKMIDYCILRELDFDFSEVTKNFK